jgi:ABC-type transport system involved in cytochrome bd biosynthesis fused ATPase/permease subunit
LRESLIPGSLRAQSVGKDTMKTTLIAGLAALALSAAAPALAQPAAAPAAGAMSVQTTKIAEIIKNPQAKAALEKILPEIPQYYDQIADMTLAEVAPMSQGALDDAKLKLIQAELDKIK